MNIGDDDHSGGGLTTKSYVPGGDLTGGAGGHDHSIGGASARHAHSVSSQGGGAAHNNMQPSIAMNFIITL
jgi:microcystin-dependent protein